MSSNNNQNVKEAQIQAAYTELNKLGELGNFEKALKSVNQSKSNYYMP